MNTVTVAKKINKLIAVLACLLFAMPYFISCEKPETNDDSQNQEGTDNSDQQNPDKQDEYAGGEVIIKARIEDGMQTKVNYPKPGFSAWNAGDRIMVVAIHRDGVIHRKVQFATIEDGNEINFVGLVPAGYKIAGYAVYPYSSKHYVSIDNGEVTALGVYTGEVTSKDIGDGQVHMVGKQDSDGTFVFRHLTGALRMNLVNMPSESISVTMNSAKNLTGCYDVNLDNSTFSGEYDNGSTSFTVKAHADYYGNAQAVFPLPEGTYTDLSFTVSDSDGEVLTQTFPQEITIKKGEFQDLQMELVIDTSADFSRWMRKDTTFVNHIETVDLAQQGQLQNGCDTLFYMFDSKALYGYISVPITTATLQAQLRELHVYIDHNDDQTTQFNPSYDLGWLDLNGRYNYNGIELNGRYDLRFDGIIYKSGRIRKIEDSPVTLRKICPTQQPDEGFGWMGGVSKGNSTKETFEAGYPGYIGSGVLDENNRFRYQFELQRDAALITDNDLKGYTMSGQVTGIVTVLVVVSDPSYGHSSICPDRGGAFLKMLDK